SRRGFQLASRSSRPGAFLRISTSATPTAAGASRTADMPPPSRPHRASLPPRRGPRSQRRPLPPPPEIGPDGTPQISLSPRGTERWQSGHPWIYRADLLHVPPLAGGEVVRVVDARGWFLGKAFYSSTSKIALRWVSFEDVAVGAELLSA